MNKTTSKIILLNILVLILLNGCSKENESIILLIDEFELSKESFIHSYNIGPAILKYGSNPKLTYLNAIENDYIIAQYLITQGYGKDSSLSKTLRLFRQELIVEKVFKEDVDNKIKISKDEIRKEILKGEKQVKIKYIYSKNYQEAVELIKELDSGTSFDKLQESKLLKLGLTTDAGETGFINYGEVENEINDVIFSLPPNKVSNVIKTNAGYFILKVVNVRHPILSEYDIKELFPTYKKIIYNKKMYAHSKQYLKEILDRKEIVVDGKIFKKFVNTLYPIYKKNKKSDNINFEQNQEFFKVDDYKLSEEFLKEDLVRYNSGAFTVGDILYHLSYYPVSFPTTSIKNFAESLKKKIGLRLRDIFLEQEGIKRGYENDPLIKEEISMWKNQIVTYRYLQRLSDETTVDTADVIKIYEEKIRRGNVPFDKVKHRFLSNYKDNLIYQKLQKVIKSRKLRRDIFINTTLLDKIDVPEKQNNFGVDLFTYKMGLPYSRIAFAMPNRIWAAENAWDTILNINK